MNEYCWVHLDHTYVLEENVGNLHNESVQRSVFHKIDLSRSILIESLNKLASSNHAHGLAEERGLCEFVGSN